MVSNNEPRKISLIKIADNVRQNVQRVSTLIGHANHARPTDHKSATTTGTELNCKLIDECRMCDGPLQLKFLVAHKTATVAAGTAVNNLRLARGLWQNLRRFNESINLIMSKH